MPSLSSSASINDQICPKPVRLCLFGTVGNEKNPIVDLDTLEENGYFGQLKEDRKASLTYPLKFVDCQHNVTDPVYQNTHWIEEAIRQTQCPIDKTKLTAYIRYQTLKSILLRIDGTKETAWPVNVEWRGDNSVSLWAKGASCQVSISPYKGTGIFLAATALTLQNLPLEGEEIPLGKTDNYAVYNLIYEKSQLIVSKNPSGRLDEKLTEGADLVELRSISADRNPNVECPSRRMSCYTDIKFRNVVYEEVRSDRKVVYKVLDIKEVKSVNQMADKMDQRLVEQLLCALEERKDDNIHKIWVYPPVKIDDDHDYSAYVVMKNRDFIWIYNVNRENNCFEEAKCYAKDFVCGTFPRTMHIVPKYRKKAFKYDIDDSAGETSRFIQAISSQKQEHKAFIVVEGLLSEREEADLLEKYALVVNAEDVHIWNSLANHCLKNIPSVLTKTDYDQNVIAANRLNSQRSPRDWRSREPDQNVNAANRGQPQGRGFPTRGWRNGGRPGPSR